MKRIINRFLENKKTYPFFAGFVSGLYPFLFYYSNNFFSIYSKTYFLYFLFVFIVFPALLFSLLYYSFKVNRFLSKYRYHLLFVLLITITASLMSQAMFLVFRKKLLFLIFVTSILMSIKWYSHYKKIIVIILFMCFIPLGKCLINFYEYKKNMDWVNLPDDIDKTVLKHKPNIYIIQPDGYVSESLMKQDPYNHKSEIYDWLTQNDFKVYDNIRSNYPASLTSNASMFSMKQHYFSGMLFPSLELPHARNIITGNNPVISIFKNNGYKTHFIVQDEYFQKSTLNKYYDYYNIEIDEIPFFSNDNNVKKIVFDDLKREIIKRNKSPKFFFIEKLMPHHVHFKGTEEKDREFYVNRVDSVNIWLKETIDYIVMEDSDALIAILADHGGWLGNKSYNEMFQTKDKTKLSSIFYNLAAVRWSGYLKENYDTKFKSNVNFFRILFSSLSENKKYLEHLEDDSSFNLNAENYFKNSVYKIFDDSGSLLLKEH